MRGDYQLPTSAETYVSIKTRNGSTYRIIAEQPDELPAYYGNKFATAHIEGCRPNADSTFTTGFVTQFPNYDGEPFRSVSCNTITGSFDPNEKISFPTGYAVQHFIEKNTDIEYQINFQNTGNDTAIE
ncbi:MAG: hypothetical protein IPL21_07175 [Saprospirales bacterium]|nr:hypothetical protein [Saprospirales bacterium]